LEEKKLIEKVKDELITKYGEKTDDGIAITPFVDILDDEGNVTGKQYNENFIKFTNEYNQLLENKSKEIEYPVITKEDLKNAGESNDDYKILFKLVKK
jgi:predicted HNH restriction endonuclease